MSQRPFILAMDQGTTSSRAILFDHAGLPVHTIQREFPQIFPRPGWVEHDPRDIWTSQLSVATDVISRAGVAVGDVQAVGITNQRETTLVWDRRTGDPVYNAIVWQDRRTADFCDRLTREGFAGLITAKTGLVIDPYFSATKIRWILDSVAGAHSDAEAGHLAFGTVDSWLLWKLTGGVVHATDFSNASRTMLLNIHTGQWDEELLNAMQVPRTMLPEVRPSSGEFGECITGIFGMPLPILAVAGDQQSALFGQACFDRGLAKNTYGTGCFMLMNIGDDPVPSHHKLLTTGAWNIDGKFTYALEGAVFAGGAVVQWLRDGLKLIDTAHQVEALALAVPDSGGVYLVPAFAGLGAPHWDPYARGTLIGLTRGTTAGHIARAALDAIAYQVADVLDTMRDDSGVEIKQLRADGGAAVNDLLMQTQADVLGVPVVRPKVIETTALGAAYLAGLACGYWRGINDIRSNWQVERVFEPSLAEDQRDANRSRWRKALKRSMNWEE